MSGYFQVELEFVGYHCDELAVGRLAAGVLDGVATDLNSPIKSENPPRFRRSLSETSYPQHF